LAGLRSVIGLTADDGFLILGITLVSLPSPAKTVSALQSQWFNPTSLLDSCRGAKWFHFVFFRPAIFLFLVMSHLAERISNNVTRHE
jgi:hypothetical protein